MQHLIGQSWHSIESDEIIKLFGDFDFLLVLASSGTSAVPLAFFSSTTVPCRAHDLQTLSSEASIAMWYTSSFISAPHISHCVICSFKYYFYIRNRGNKI